MDEQRKQGIAGMFTRSAPTYDQVGPQFFGYFGKRLVDLVDIPPDARVLDIATGRGAVLFPAAERAMQGSVIGVDLAEGMVSETKAEITRRNLQNADVRQMDAEALDFPDDHFDIVTCGFALFFLPDLQKGLSEIVRVLKPGGRFVTSTWGADDQNWAWMGELYKKYQSQNMPPPPMTMNRFNHVAGMENVLGEAGFTSIRVIDEDRDFVYADEAAWWQTQWSHGARFMLEMMPPETRDQFQVEAYENLRRMKQADGIHHMLYALITLGTKA